MRSGENVWAEIQAKSRDYMKSGRTFAVGRYVNKIIAVEDTKIRRESTGAKRTEARAIPKSQVLNLWESLVENNSEAGVNALSGTRALVVEMIPGVSFDGRFLTLRDRSAAMRPFRA